ncbi:hypothetical protein C5689_06370 [Methylosinus sporium]|uniref:Uncharacterized protein n=1 Tax=Methylosinus sporium TaxID=428 RepID=A0A2U1SSV4_METSR|nr:hypothetical protein C5689_06370 [Methylosinus sporium]
MRAPAFRFAGDGSRPHADFYGCRGGDGRKDCAQPFQFGGIFREELVALAFAARTLFFADNFLRAGHHRRFFVAAHNEVLSSS